MGVSIYRVLTYMCQGRYKLFIHTNELPLLMPAYLMRNLRLKRGLEHLSSRLRAIQWWSRT